MKYNSILITFFTYNLQNLKNQQGVKDSMNIQLFIINLAIQWKIQLLCGSNEFFKKQTQSTNRDRQAK